MSYRVREDLTVRIFEAVFLQHDGYVPRNNQSLVVSHIFGRLGPVQMGRLVKVPSEDNDPSGFPILFSPLLGSKR